MRVLLVGAGAVGSAVAVLAARRSFFDSFVVSDGSLERAEDVAHQAGDARFQPELVDASDAAQVTELCRRHGITHVLNAVDPRFVLPVFHAAFDAGACYMDMAMSLSHPDPERPYERPGVKLGDEQFAEDERWRRAGLLALVGMGVEPGLSDVFARYAADVLFSRIDEIVVRDGSNLVVAGYDFAPTFSIWTTIEECLNPPLRYDRGSGFSTEAPFSDPDVFDFPGGIGPVECVDVEHEEVVLIPRVIDAGSVRFKYGLGREFIDVLRTLHRVGLDRTDPIDVHGQRVSPREVLAAVLPDPSTLGERMTGSTCAGTWVRGLDKEGRQRAVYLYHVVDNAWTMSEFGCQAVAWQTAMNPVVALELLATGAWSGAGVLGPESFEPVPFLDLLARGPGQQWHIDDRSPRLAALIDQQGEEVPGAAVHSSDE